MGVPNTAVTPQPTAAANIDLLTEWLVLMSLKAFSLASLLAIPQAIWTNGPSLPILSPAQNPTQVPKILPMSA